ncbi:MAG: hypothetical protein ACR2MN_05040 [Acidimicrobiales bacterium]
MHALRPSTVGDGGPGLAGHRRPRRRTAAGIVALIAAGAWPVVALVRLVGQRNGANSPAGDQALMELGARRALHFAQLLGPYSRYGWHHPGPVLFYVLALPVWLFGSGPGLNVAMALINGAAVVGTVAYVWRRNGVAPALWAAASLSGLCLALTFGPILGPWNPNVLVLPLAAFVVLWADAVRGHLGALAWAAVVASFVAQSHISAAPFALSMILVAAVGAVVVRRRQAVHLRMHAPRVAVRAGVLLLVASLVAPIVELGENHPNNLSLLFQFFAHGDVARTSLSSALRQSTNALTVMPFGVTIDANLTFVDRGVAKIVGAASVMAAIAIVGLVIARRRRQIGAQLIILGAVAGAVIGVVATTRIDGDPVSYVVQWMAFVPCVLLIGFGGAVFGRESNPVLASATGERTSDAGPRVRRSLGDRVGPSTVVVAALAVIALGLGAVLVRYQLRLPALIGVNDPAVLALTAATDRAVPQGHQAIEIEIVDFFAWPDAAAVTLGLQREGHVMTVSPVMAAGATPGAFEPWAAGQLAPLQPRGRPAPPTLAFFMANNPSPPPGRVLGRAGDVVEVLRSGG